MKTEIIYYQEFWPLVSQDASVVNANDKRYIMDNYIPDLVRAWAAIEQTTGYRWKCTSFLRQSETHSLGQAIDIAPDIAPNSEQYYAVTNGSDPVLYKRAKLIRDLQTVAASFPQGKFTIGVFIEPDHLHMQVLAPNAKLGPMRIFKWKIPKPIYKDTYDRMALPLITTS